MIKRFVGYVLSKIYDQHDNTALDMPRSTDRERELALAYKNYNLPLRDIEDLVRTASAEAAEEKNNVCKRYYFHTRFYWGILRLKLGI